jgi:mono/diheme cytochrome c family protein
VKVSFIDRFVKIGDRHQIGAVKAAPKLVFCCAIWSLSPIFKIYSTQFMEKRTRRKLSVLALILALGLISRVLTESSSSAARAHERGVGSGEAHFEKLCAGCHGSDGLASDGEAPPLAGASWVAGPEARLVRIVMHGVRGPIQVANEIYDREMPGFGAKLSDDEMASLLSFVRGRWGGPSAPITPDTVSRIRAADGNRTRYWTAQELLAAP